MRCPEECARRARAFSGAPEFGGDFPGIMLPMILPPVENVPLTRLEHLRPLMKNVNCKVIVLKKRTGQAGGAC